MGRTYPGSLSRRERDPVHVRKRRDGYTEPTPDTAHPWVFKRWEFHILASGGAAVTKNL